MQKENILAWAKARMLVADDSPLEKGYRWYHGQRTAKLAINLANLMGLEIDHSILEMGALLHDIGKAGYKGPEPHGPRGAAIIRLEAAEFFSGHELERVSAIVENHYQRPRSRYLEGKSGYAFPPEVLLVQDADTLDHFGANALWLSIKNGGQDGLSQADCIQRFYEDDPPWHQEAYSALNYATSRQELEHRLAFMRDFYTFWRLEEQGELTFLESRLVQ